VSAEILARAGVGRLTLVDRDFVELVNLQRQSLFTERDAVNSMPKAVAAENAIREINSEVDVHGIVEDVTFESIQRLCEGSQLIVDGSDNFEVRFLINDYCVKNNLPWVYAAVLGSYGISFPIVPHATPCLRCLFQELPPPGTIETCETVGILASVVHMVSAYQTAQVLRLLVGGKVSGEIFQADVWDDKARSFAFKEPLDSCPCCVGEKFPFLEGYGRSVLTQLCGRNAVQIRPVSSGKFDLEAAARRLSATLEVTSNEYLLRAVAGKHDIVVFHDGRAIIKGTADSSEARAVYSKYIGT
jgi:adenylyltransferase/sulfurtransferase